MLTRLLLVMLLATPFVPGQGKGGGGSGAPPMQTRDPAPLDEFVDRLRLDENQVTQVQKILQGAANEAVPVSAEMIKLRQQMLAIEMSGKSDELAPVLSAYTTAAAKMTGIEIRAFDTVKTVLKSGQLSRVADGFVVIAGVFNPPTPRQRPGAPRGGGGQ